MLLGYHNVFKRHAGQFVLARDVDVPKPELAVDFAEIKNPIIPPVDVKTHMPVRVKTQPVKTLDDYNVGWGRLFTEKDFPKYGWMGDDLWRSI